MTLKVQKDSLRKKFLSKRINYPKPNSQDSSLQICNNLENTDEFKSSRKVLFYMPIKNEVDTLPLIKKYLNDKEILLPSINDQDKISINQVKSLDDLHIGKYGILESKENSTNLTPDLVIVPGIAFDKKGFRIGFGKGYYDRLLKNLKCKKIALAYDFQILENIPGEKHDEKVDLIITESKLITPKP